MLAGGFISDVVKGNLSDVIWIGAGVVTLSSVWRQTPAGKAVRWLWRKNVSGPAGAWAQTQVRHTVEPMLETVKTEVMSASRQQHDEQNRRLDVLEAHIARDPTTRSRSTDQPTATLSEEEQT